MLFIFSDLILAFSIDIDGIHTSDEWDGATVDKLLDGESNCGVNFGLVKTVINGKESALYLCFMFKETGMETDDLDAGVSVCVENSESFTVTASASPSFYDSSDYSFDGAVNVDENNGATAEIRVGFKHGLPEIIKCNVRFIDSDSAMSNDYRFDVINEEYSETTEKIITRKESGTTKKEKNSKVRNETTKKKTQKTEKTDKKRTEKPTESTTEWKGIEPDGYSYVRRTKARTTKKQTTALTQKSKPMSAKAYYYEKETVISHIFITHSETDSTTIKITEALTSMIHTQTATPDVPSTEIKSSFSLSEGTKKKAIIGVFAAISFTVIAAAGTRSAKKSSDNDKDPDTQ